VDAYVVLRLELRRDGARADRVRTGGLRSSTSMSGWSIVCWSPGPAGQVGGA
jgi:hypothetical protein